jgi:hypothetical protein
MIELEANNRTKSDMDILLRMEQGFEPPIPKEEKVLTTN